MVDRHGVVKVLDFGVARAFGASGVTTDGSASGTPAYMSPEQLGDKPLGPRSDLFSLGLTFHQMVTGRHLLRRATTVPELFSALVFIDRLVAQKRVRERLDRLHPGLGRLTAQLLEADPSRRPANAGEVSDRLGAMGIAAGPRELGRFLCASNQRREAPNPASQAGGAVRAATERWADAVTGVAGDLDAPTEVAFG